MTVLDDPTADPTAFLAAIDVDASPRIDDEDGDSWDRGQAETLATLADELGPFEWGRMMEQADRREVDPRFVLRAIESESLPEETLSLDGANVATHLPFVLPAWEERHGPHPWYEPPRRSLAPPARCILVRPRRRETRSQSRRGRPSARARSPGRRDGSEDDPGPPDAPPKGAA